MQHVQTLLDRPKFYYNIDGVGELAVGFMLAGFTAFEWIAAYAQRDSIWNKIYTLYVFVALLCAIIHYGTNAIRAFLSKVYSVDGETPRTCYGATIFGRFAAEAA